MDFAAQVAVLVTPGAWAYHEALPEEQQVDLEAAAAVLGSDPRLVAAYLLDVVAAHARSQAASAPAALKRMRVEGEIEIERFAPGSSLAADADAWAALAGGLRAGVAAEKRRAARAMSRSVPVEVAW
ncbi:hypothetical protein [Deinococcus sp. YIM 77859]|uniref:hypothetical protein n=1 Tax=Deinococcus sp. YIM 77859 TaxID=1540221 RepID=UPI000557757A|nr:hypothetical protein [Deinococcus sp. YIM 77859]